MALFSDGFRRSFVGPVPVCKRLGPDSFVIFSKHVPQPRLDVDLVHTLEHDSIVCCVHFSADGKYLATGCNHSSQIFDTQTGAKICVLVDASTTELGYDCYLRSVRFSPDGLLLATAAEDRKIRVWNIASKSLLTVFEGHQHEVYSLDFSRDSRLIVSGSGDMTARIWDLETGDYRTLIDPDPPVLQDAPIFTSVAISPDGRLVAVGSLDTIVRLWDFQTGQFLERLRGHTDSVYTIGFTPDGKGLVSGSLDSALKHWDLGPLLQWERGGGYGGAVTKEMGGTREQECVCTVDYRGHKASVLSVGVSHDNRWLVSGSRDWSVQFWDLRTAQPQLVVQGHTLGVTSIDLLSTGGMLATGSGDGSARLWSYRTIL